MNTLIDLIVANQALVTSVVIMLLTVSLLYHFRKKLAYIIQEVDYQLPWVGRMSRLMRRRNHHPDADGWFPAELKVCADYHRFFRSFSVNQEFFNNCRAYLEKAAELHRRPKPWYLWSLIVVMIFAEAYGFSYVLAMSPWAFAQAAVRDVPFLAGSIALLLAVVAVFLTEKAGHDLYLNSAARRVRTDFAQRPDNAGLTLQPTHQSVRLEKPQNVDDGELQCLQALNRLSRRPDEISYLWPVIATVVIMGIAGGSTYIRHKAFERDLILQQQVVEQERAAASARIAVDPRLPRHLNEQSGLADQKARDDQIKTDEQGAWASFGMLAFIFVALQLVAIMLGYGFGFAGRESKHAWRVTHAFDDAADYRNYHLNRRLEISSHAQARLSDIQGRIRKWVERHPTGGDQIDAAKNAGKRTFLNYVAHIPSAAAVLDEER